MAKVLINGTLGWDIPIWLDKPFKSGDRIRARTLDGFDASGNLPGRLGGGAANIAASLIQAGHEVWVHGQVGNDAAGGAIIDALKLRGINTKFISIGNFSSPSAHILIEPNGERTIIGVGWGAKSIKSISKTSRISSGELAKLNFDCLIMRASWPKLECRPPLIISHMPAFSNDIFESDIVIGGFSDLDHVAWESPLSIARAICPSAKWAIVTDGKNGLVGQSDADNFTICLDDVRVVDATGAGDVFMAGVADALLAGATMHTACGHGAKWGAICVGVEGSAINSDTRKYDAFIREPNARELSLKYDLES